MSDWHDWRAQGIGSSDAPIVMGVSKWQKPRSLWELKAGLREREDKTNFAIERGNEFEPIARRKFAAIYNFEFDKDETFDPKTVEMSELPFMRASLDGISKCQKRIIEIKYQGKTAHDQTKDGVVPEHYFPQIQHQLLVTGAKICYFISFNKETLNYCEVKPDNDYQAALLKQCSIFWKHVQDKVWPYEGPYMVESKPGLDDLFTTRFMLEDQIKDLNERKKEIEKLILDEAKGKELKSGKYYVKFTERKGSIVYKDIKELEGVDLEQYRSNPIKIIKFGVNK